MPINAKSERECVEQEIHHLYHVKKYSKNRAVAASLHICQDIFGKKKKEKKGRKQ